MEDDIGLPGSSEPAFDLGLPDDIGLPGDISNVIDDPSSDIGLSNS